MRWRTGSSWPRFAYTQQLLMQASLPSPVALLAPSPHCHARSPRGARLTGNLPDYLGCDVRDEGCPGYPPHPQSTQGSSRLGMGFGEAEEENSPGAWFSFSCSSVSLCGKLLKVIKHPEVVKCTVNEVLINTPQEKNKKTPLTPTTTTRKGEATTAVASFVLFGREIHSSMVRICRPGWSGAI